MVAIADCEGSLTSYPSADQSPSEESEAVFEQYSDRPPYQLSFASIEIVVWLKEAKVKLFAKVRG